jgi:hypothetical protein
VEAYGATTFAPSIGPDARAARQAFGMDSFFDREMGKWHFSFYCLPHPDGGVQGHAHIHAGFDFLCSISLACAFASEDSLGAALNEKCVAWVKDWDARRPTP